MSVFIIAEVGVNHNGRIETALKLIDVAVKAGADAVKFQTFNPALMVLPDAPKAIYQNESTDERESQMDMLKKLRLRDEDYQTLMDYCSKAGIVFMSTPFDCESIDILDRMGMDIFKIPSGEITNLPYLKKIGSLRKRIILSTGMSSLEEVRYATKILEKAGTPFMSITILHATTEYPAPFEEVNLNAMLTIKKELQVSVGYSDHTKGIEVPIAATALGATVIEKHFTLSRELPGPDHKASLEPDELEQMVSAIRNIERALGDGIKQASPSEQKNIAIARKSICYKRSITAGDILRQEDIIMKRPGDGISPMEEEMVIGRRLRKDVLVDTKVLWDDLESE